MKQLAVEIAPILTMLYQKSYETGQTPKDWKRAEVAPVFIQGSKSAACNYRQISLTCIDCKIMEHILTSNIMKHASSNIILYKLHYRFREQHSCETQLHEFQSDLLQNMKDGKQSDILMMDFFKAFDKMGNKKLMEKLSYYGISGSTNR